MRTYFADTWFFIALHDRHDGHHTRALRVQAAVANGLVLTHEAILSEVLAHFCDDGPQSRLLAGALVRDILRTFRVLTPDRRLFLRALDLYMQRPDKQYSLVDCISMVVMRDHGVTHVLTNDHHFRQEGFVLVDQ